MEKAAIRLKLGQRIRELRLERHYAQEKFAEAAHIDYKYLQRIEGKNTPNLKIETIQRIAKALHVSISKLLDLK